MPTRRTDVLIMVEAWLAFLALQGKATLLKINPLTIIELTDLKIAAAEKLALAQGAERTASITADCQAAVEVLKEAMRDMKKRYFFKPPLTDADFATLLLSARDETQTSVPVPVDHPGIEVTKRASHALGFRRFVATDMGGAHSNHGVRVYYALISPENMNSREPPVATRLTADVYVLSAPPQSPADLPNSFFTRREKDILEFPPESSGFTCYFAACFENGRGKSGPWGDMTHAIVP
jgi:hypothetical protein